MSVTNQSLDIAKDFRHRSYRTIQLSKLLKISNAAGDNNSLRAPHADIKSMDPAKDSTSLILWLLDNSDSTTWYQVRPLSAGFDIRRMGFGKNVVSVRRTFRLELNGECSCYDFRACFSMITRNNTSHSRHYSFSAENVPILGSHRPMSAKNPANERPLSSTFWSLRRASEILQRISNVPALE